MLGAVELTFDHEDERGFVAAREMLLADFARWAARDGRFTADEIDDLTGDIGVALDWKWSYADGELATWRTGDVAEFLLEWCPRKLSVTQADCVSIPLALTAFLTFLDAERLLTVGSTPVEVLTEAVVSLAEEFVLAMGDRSRFGMAKSLFAAALDEGVDATDPDALRAWMARFNDRPEEERHRLLPDSAFSGPPTSQRRLPPVVLPSDDDVAESKRAAPILTMCRDLAAFVGSGRKLTQKGNVTLADARVLVDLLGTGEVMDPAIGDRTFKTTSARELPRLIQAFAWSKKAGFIRVVHGKVVATKRGLGLARDLAGSFERSVDALLGLGPLQSQRNPEGWFAWPEVNAFLDQASVHLLAAPYATQGPIPIEEIAGMATRVVLDAFQFGISDEQVAKHIAFDVADIMDAFELAGVVRRVGTNEPVDGHSRTGGSIVLTPAGVVTVRRLLGAAGYETPVAGRLVDARASELLVETDGDEFPALYGEILAWRAAREPGQAAAEMAAAVGELDDPALQNLGLAVLAEIGVDIAAPYVRKLASEPRTRGFALCWLVDHGQAEEKALYDPSDPYPFVDVLAHRMVTGGPNGLTATLALAGDHGEQIGLLDCLWRAPSLATEMVLTALGEVHPSKIVAKAARKALFKRRSSQSGV
jgi:hypothetical protein